MFVLCVCPTYGRPVSLIENTIALFESQSHPNKYLILLDDLGNIGNQRGVDWEVISTDTRFETLPAKYNYILHKAAEMGVTWDAVAQWDDDDVYLPDHLLEISRGCEMSRWVYPTMVGTTYNCKFGEFDLEKTRGNFSAALGVRKDFLMELGGWPITNEMNFDQQLIRQLSTAPPYDPTAENKPITFIMRWGDTGANHCSVGRDSAWYSDYPPQSFQNFPRLVSKYDDSTLRLRETHQAKISQAQ